MSPRQKAEESFTLVRGTASKIAGEVIWLTTADGHEVGYELPEKAIATLSPDDAVSVLVDNDSGKAVAVVNRSTGQVRWIGIFGKYVKVSGGMPVYAGFNKWFGFIAGSIPFMGWLAAITFPFLLLAGKPFSARYIGYSNVPRIAGWLIYCGSVVVMFGAFQQSELWLLQIPMAMVGMWLMGMYTANKMEEFFSFLVEKVIEEQGVNRVPA